MTDSALIEVDDLNFETEVLASDLPFLLDFTAEWCAPCKVLLPMLERIANAHVGRFKLGRLDIERAALTAARLGIRGAPTLIVFVAGVEAERRIGTAPEKTVLSLLTRCEAKRPERTRAAG